MSAMKVEKQYKEIKIERDRRDEIEWFTGLGLLALRSIFFIPPVVFWEL